MDLLRDGVAVRCRGAIVHKDHVADRLEGLHEWPDEAGHRVVEEDHLVLAVVHDVGELFGEQPQVEGMGHPAGAWRGEVELQVASRVPSEGGHPAVITDAQVVQYTAQAAGSFTPLAVRDPLDPRRGGG